jgi:serine/threonine protein phosphatase PrpC
MIRSTSIHRDRVPRRPALTVESAGATDIGGRESNQDQYLIADVRRRLQITDASIGSLWSAKREHTPVQVFAVADGMGGQAGGACASQLVVETIAHALETVDAPNDGDVPRHLLQLFNDCQSAVGAHVRLQPQHRGMGTTLTLAWVAWPMLHLAHAGDSRAYLLRGGQLRQLTTDHTLAQQFIESGADAPLPKRWEHTLWNVIGGDGRSLKPELHAHELHEGDLLLLCTDGLTRGLSDAELIRIMQQHQPLNQAVQQLIETSKQVDGRDNITAVAVRFVNCGSGRAFVSARRQKVLTDTWPTLATPVSDDSVR